MNVNSDASDAAVNLSNDGSAPITVNSEVDGNFVNKIPPKVEGFQRDTYCLIT